MCLQLFFRCFQFLPQLSQFGFQFVPPLIGLTRLLLGAFPALGFFSQCVRQSLDSLQNACLDGLKFRGPCHQPGLFVPGGLQLCGMSFLRRAQSVLQHRLRLLGCRELTVLPTALTIIARLLLGLVPTLGNQMAY